MQVVQITHNRHLYIAFKHFLFIGYLFIFQDGKCHCECSSHSKNELQVLWDQRMSLHQEVFPAVQARLANMQHFIQRTIHILYNWTIRPNG